MKQIPFVSLGGALVGLRIATALLFMAHSVVRVVKGTIPQFGAFLESIGFPYGEVWVWAITVAELLAGTLLIIGRRIRWAATALFAIAAAGIVLIHRHFGWFVGEHGTGGSEYSVALLVMLVVIAAEDAGRQTS
jgi:putative oxidoreductase